MIGGEFSTRRRLEHVMQEATTEVTRLVLPGVGHFVAEQPLDALATPSVAPPCTTNPPQNPLERTCRHHERFHRSLHGRRR
ncbi:hypothetical protein FRAHR75_1620006 [Frankia sp. Hr75.2]|nr:hypothetical protein FRAHR75_1620006 [Frankia sp. Hr75.2]